ncbi:HD domain-containing protein [uncultured Subdoligranulum sp.]|uniref:HD domain-containing protein n=1 Tax=uncultured Subdoligranulum sp. TaxID=512298 RepID=UPI00261441BB|nr:HD domain-containing protein [uncultured Subdoligranulum sp.]
MPLNLEQIKKSEEINSYIRKADESLSALGYTEHSFAHVGRVSALASEILQTLGYDARTAELAAIAGWLHDIGNVVNRHDHAQSGAIMAFRILDKMGAAPDEVATVITAIGNHDEATAYPVNPVAAALILADKTDVRTNRVRNQDPATFDIHDRVNFAVKESQVILKDGVILLRLGIDTTNCAVMDYFEIFLDRMRLCREAAKVLGQTFALEINGQKMI